MSRHSDMDALIGVIQRAIEDIRNSNHTVFGALVRAAALLDRPAQAYPPDELAAIVLEDFASTPRKGTQRLQTLNRHIEPIFGLPATFVSHDGRWTLSERGADLVRAFADITRAAHVLHGVGQAYQPITIQCYEVHLHRFLTTAAVAIRQRMADAPDITWEPSIRRQPAETVGHMLVHGDPLAPRSSIWIGGGASPARGEKPGSVLDIPLYSTTLCLFLSPELKSELWNERYVVPRRDGRGEIVRSEHGEPIGYLSAAKLKAAIADLAIAVALPPESTFSRRRIDDLLGSLAAYNTQYFTRPSGTDALTWARMNPRSAALLSDDYLYSDARGLSALDGIVISADGRRPLTLPVCAHVYTDEVGPLHCMWLLALVDHVREHANVPKGLGLDGDALAHLDVAEQVLRARLASQET
jgi:hypothetical protein